MIVFLTHEKDSFAKQCYLMLKYQHQVPTRWFTWSMFQQQAQCHSLEQKSIFNAILPAPKQICVLYLNLIGLNDIQYQDYKHDRYQQHSWLAFLMWYTQQIKCVINPMTHEMLSPSLRSAVYIRRSAFALGLCHENKTENKKSALRTVCTIVDKQFFTKDNAFLSILGHEKIHASLALMRQLDLTFGQLFFDQSQLLTGLSAVIYSEIDVEIITCATRFMINATYENGVGSPEMLEELKGWSISPCERPDMI